MEPIRVVCINDSHRPSAIPPDRWIKKDEEYTIVQLDYMNMQGRILGVKLAEINNDDLVPYTHFNLKRFAPLDPLIEDMEAEQAVKDLMKEIDSGVLEPILNKVT